MVLPDVFIDHDAPDKMYERAGLAAPGIVATVLAALGRETLSSRRKPRLGQDPALPGRSLLRRNFWYPRREAETGMRHFRRRTDLGYLALVALATPAFAVVRTYARPARARRKSRACLPHVLQSGRGPQLPAAQEARRLRRVLDHRRSRHACSSRAAGTRPPIICRRDLASAARPGASSRPSRPQRSTPAVHPCPSQPEFSSREAFDARRPRDGRLRCFSCDKLLRTR